MTVRYYSDTNEGRQVVVVEVGQNGASTRPLTPADWGKYDDPPLYDWGRECGAARRLARAILADATGTTVIPDRWAAWFVADHVAHWPRNWRITRGAVLRAVQCYMEGLHAPRLWVDGPPDPPEPLMRWLAECEWQTWATVARLAGHGCYEGLADYLAGCGKPRDWAPLIRCELPDAWLDDV